MELMTSVLGSVVAEISRFFCGFIWSETKNSVRFKSNFNDLEKKLELLKDVRYKMENELDDSVSMPKVTGWLTEVEGIQDEVNSVLQSIAANKKKCCGGFFSCCQWSRELAKTLEKVQMLQKEGNSIISMAAANRKAHAVEHMPGPSVENQSTASQNLARIMDLLNDDGVKSIGVWGMGGVGKTTLVKNLNNKLENASSAQPFGVVIWVTVSKDLDLRRIQMQIAHRLNVEVKMEESTESLAVKLFRRLKRTGKFLLILDDVWKGIDLDALGVPRPEVHTGCKIIITTRFLDVCRQMKIDKRVNVQILNYDEAWELFCQNAGEVATLKPIKPLAETVTKKCDGLPLAIIIMATSMRGKKKVELWKDALNELQNSQPENIPGIEDQVYRVLKWSYDSLQGKNMKSCFLVCSLFPEDFSIDISELTKYWLAEGLIDEHQTYDNIHNRGFAVAEYLKDCCLLEHGDPKETTVKMHDVVRDVAIWIASSLEHGCKSLVRSGIRLRKVSESEMLKLVKRISYMNNEIERLPDCPISCSEATTLLLQGNSPLERVPEGFLLGFPALRVLNLGETKIQRLPHSLLQQGELRALILRQCSSLEELPSLGGLRRLQVLDCSCTDLKELPEGMEQLSCLRVLNLSYTKQLQTFAARLVSGLSGLEVLEMIGSNYKWGVRQKMKEGEATFKDLGCLEQLIRLSIELESIIYPSSENISWFGRLKSFEFSVGSLTHGGEGTNLEERLVIIDNLDLSGEWIEWMLSDAISLSFHRCSGLNKMLENLATRSSGCFASLKSLSIMFSHSMFILTGGSYGGQYDLLPNLEKLHLSNLFNLESISELGVHLGLRFSRLRQLEVLGCPKIKYLLSYDGVDLFLENLEEIKVEYCDNLRGLFIHNSRRASSMPTTLGSVVPNLRKVQLGCLPQLTTLSREEETWPHLEHLIVRECRNLNKLPLNVQSANSIKEIRGELIWWDTLEWDNHETWSTLRPFFRAMASHPGQL